jgi:hypothetical protein
MMRLVRFWAGMGTLPPKKNHDKVKGRGFAVLLVVRWLWSVTVQRGLVHGSGLQRADAV